MTDIYIASYQWHSVSPIASTDNSDSGLLDAPFPPRSNLVPIPGWLVDG